MNPYLNRIRIFLFSKAILEGVASGLIVLALSYIYVVALHYPLPISSNLFWRSFAEDLVIVSSGTKESIDPPMRPGDESETRNPLHSETAASDQLRDFFRSIGLPKPQIINNDATLFDRNKNKNILILGGPKHNEASDRFLREIQGELFWRPMRILPGTEKLGEQEKKVFVGRNSNYPNFTFNFQTGEEPAIIILKRDIYAKGKYVLLIAGLSQESTLAGVQWILSQPASFWLSLRRQGGGFQAIILCRVLSRDKVSNIRTASYQKLL